MINFAQVGNDLYTGKRSIEFIKRQKTWYAISAVLIVLALVGIFVKGLNFGIEFSGGSEFRIQGVSNSQGYEEKAQTAIAEAGIEGNVVATIVGQDTVRVQSEAAADRTDEARTALAQQFGVEEGAVSASLIGPSWGQSVSQQAIRGLIVFLVLVTIVMALYFRTWKMAVAGLVALLHDLIITVGIYALFGFEITPSSMIGFLTILGYSLYDTVVVFDKVRENTADAFRTKRMTYSAAANLAVNQTLVRSINTTVVALLPIAAVLFVGFTLLGPGTLLDLSLALFIGIAVGAYSSIFIATPLLVDLRRKEPAVLELDKYVERHGAGQAAGRSIRCGRAGRRRRRQHRCCRDGGAGSRSTAHRAPCTSTPRPARATSPSAPRSRSADGVTASAAPPPPAVAHRTSDPSGDGVSQISDLVASKLRDIPDFPKPGVLFKDFTPLIADGAALGELVRDIAQRYAGQVDVVVGIEARGFILGAAVAYELGLGMVPVRKAGKLPGETLKESYALEYGTAEIEVHTDAFEPGQRVLVLDDVLATGGTAEACAQLVERAGATVAAIEVVLELAFLDGRQRLVDRPVNAILTV